MQSGSGVRVGLRVVGLAAALAVCAACGAGGSEGGAGGATASSSSSGGATASCVQLGRGDGELDAVDAGDAARPHVRPRPLARGHPRAVRQHDHRREQRARRCALAIVHQHDPRAHARRLAAAQRAPRRAHGELAADGAVDDRRPDAGERAVRGVRAPAVHERRGRQRGGAHAGPRRPGHGRGRPVRGARSVLERLVVRGLRRDQPQRQGQPDLCARVRPGARHAAAPRARALRRRRPGHRAPRRDRPRHGGLRAHAEPSPGVRLACVGRRDPRGHRRAGLPGALVPRAELEPHEHATRAARGLLRAHVRRLVDPRRRGDIGHLRHGDDLDGDAELRCTAVVADRVRHVEHVD